MENWSDGVVEKPTATHVKPESGCGIFETNTPILHYFNTPSFCHL
jgi:hypothetical protein